MYNGATLENGGENKSCNLIHLVFGNCGHGRIRPNGRWLLILAFPQQHIVRGKRIFLRSQSVRYKLLQITSVLPLGKFLFLLYMKIIHVHNTQSINEEVRTVPEKKTLSVPEAAKILGISQTRMYQLAKSAGFPTISVGRRILISVKGLDRWLEEQAQKGYSTT